MRGGEGREEERKEREGEKKRAGKGGKKEGVIKVISHTVHVHVVLITSTHILYIMYVVIHVHSLVL